MDQAAVGSRDPAVDSQGRVDLVHILVERQTLGFDRVVDEMEPRRRLEDLDQAVAIDVIGRIFDFDGVLVLKEFLGIRGRHGMLRPRLDPLEEDIGGQGRPAQGSGGFAGNQAHGDIGEARIDLGQGHIPFQVIVGIAAVAGNESSGAVAGGAVQLEHPLALILEEKKMELALQPLPGFALVKPGFTVIDSEFSREPLDFLGLT